MINLISTKSILKNSYRVILRDDNTAECYSFDNDNGRGFIKIETNPDVLTIVERDFFNMSDLRNSFWKVYISKECLNSGLCYFSKYGNGSAVLAYNGYPIWDIPFDSRKKFLQLVSEFSILLTYEMVIHLKNIISKNNGIEILPEDIDLFIECEKKNDFTEIELLIEVI